MTYIAVVFLILEDTTTLNGSDRRRRGWSGAGGTFLVVCMNRKRAVSPIQTRGNGLSRDRASKPHRGAS